MRARTHLRLAPGRTAAGDRGLLAGINLVKGCLQFRDGIGGSQAAISAEALHHVIQELLDQFAIFFRLPE